MIMCSVDECVVSGVRGWAIDEQNPSAPVILHALIDGEPLVDLTCSDLREDVAAAGFKSGNVGFAFRLPEDKIDGREHRLELRSRQSTISMLYRGAFVQHVDFNLEHPLRMHGYIDGLTQGVLRGWVVARRGEGRLEGGHDLLVTCNEERIGQIRADRYRGDVGKALSCDPNCGFQFVPQPHQRSAFPKPFRFFLLPGMHELDNSPYTTSFVTDQREATALEVIEQIDKIHADLTRLRRQVRAFLPEPGFTLADYDDWTRSYLPALRERVLAARSPARAQGPLVSIVMPVYRPKLEEFRAAVASIRAQTYRRWELVIADDASGDPVLADAIDEMAASDPRIRTLRLERNGGISRATNAAIEAASGAWIAFFDHDDLLVDVALEHMLDEARATGATLLYSDEDKVDSAGYFTEPAFKTDWNYRLLLGVNYICHFVMVERATLDRAGRLDPRFDGAQDHDLLLRLAEIVPERRIHHVPEILYHWRMSENSTASDIGNKRYAIDAGVGAIQAHLDRRNLEASVTSLGDLTLYKVAWTLPRTPKVSIIVPYKDQIGTTSRCLESLLAHTDYPDYEIVMVDNWSITAEARAFADGLAGHPIARVFEVREPFNYARLNNLAAAGTDAEFLLFLNNDVFVEDPAWLRVLVAEMLVDPRVGIVGGKFVYPNRTIQHAGVVLGIGDVAGHSHVGIPESEFGYGGRAMFTQEMSAVTAAGMLVRTSVFQDVGGFDETALAVAFNDIDLCLKIRGAGYRVIWTPDFLAEHHESLSRGSDDRPVAERRFFHERETMVERYGDLLKQDPFYSPHFALDRQPFFDLVTPPGNRDRYPPRILAPQAEGEELPAAPKASRPARKVIPLPKGKRRVNA